LGAVSVVVSALLSAALVLLVGRGPPRQAGTLLLMTGMTS
jgi:hypothetical protein